MTTYAYPSQANTWVPSHADSGNLVVNFSRSPTDFPLNKYIQIAPIKRTVGYWMRMTLEEAGRILSTDLSSQFWADGNDAPLGNEGNESFAYLAFMAKRYAYRANLGDMAVDQASWDILQTHVLQKAQQAMTGRTQLVANVLTTSGNYVSGNTATATSAGGGTFATSTSATLYIRTAVNTMVNTVLKNTLGTVKAKDMNLVLNPDLAQQMSQSQEIVDYIKSSPSAFDYLVYKLPDSDPNMFGLPNRLYGVNVVVEDAVKVTSKKGATRATSYVWPDSTAALVSRPGALVGVAGAPSFSTATLFSYSPDEMTVETLHDRDNRRTSIRVVDTLDVEMTADISGYLLTSC